SWGLLVPRLPNVKNAIKELDPDVLDDKYTLTVNNGIGSGFYTAGDEVTIKAGFIHNDSIFSHWEVTQGADVMENITGSTAKFTMPEADVTVTQRYKYKKKTQCTISLSRDSPLSFEELVKTPDFQSLFPTSSELKFKLVIQSRKHVLSHRILYATFYEVYVKEKPGSLKDYTLITQEELSQLPLHRLMEMYFE
ncbi:hypothetical protein LJC52_05970, partial [Bacteroidales bacterium OttesenSCG-928-A17]|nr:hypothetical protein [Bacteroidales bacterium OttesenSCG-928-A17]